MKKTFDVNVSKIIPLTSPSKLKKEFPITEKISELVFNSRETVKSIIEGKDDRLIAIVGPCSINDPDAALEYAEKLNKLSNELGDKLFIIMRVYFEKPRTTIGWRGLVLDPYMDGSKDIQTGVSKARDLLLLISEMGLPIATEILDPIVPQYLADLISWAAIGARTTESQTHRDMASGLSMPVGFKNSTEGNVQVAVDAIEAANHSHSFIGMDKDGRSCIIKSAGNKYGHVILRGGRTGTNFDSKTVEDLLAVLKKKDLFESVFIDCSHANSNKDFANQSKVLNELVDRKVTNQKEISGFMLESNLFEGNQKIPENLAELKYGVSITDACVGWEETEKILREAHSKL